MRIICAFIILVHCAAVASATTYYVDFPFGKDTNSGKSEATPWRTISKVNSSTFLPGDTVLFKRGSIWRKTLIVPSSGGSGAPITFGAYGSAGAPPVISGAELITAWTRHSGSVWRAVCRVSPAVVAFNGAVGARKTALSSLTGAKAWYWSAGTLYVYSTSNPLTAYTNPGVEAGARDYCIYSKGKSWINYKGLSLKYSNRACFRADDRDNYLTLTDVTSFGAGVEGGFIFDSSANPTLIRCRSDWCKGPSNGDGFVFKTPCSNILMRDCSASYNLRRGAQFDTGIGGYIRIFGGEYHHQSGLNQSDGISIDDNDAVLIEGAYCHHNGINNDSADGIQVSGDSHNPIIRYCRLEYNYNGGIVLETDGATIAYNISNFNRHGVAICGNATRSKLVYNNTFFNNEYGIFFYELSPKAPVKVINNILYGASSLRRAAYLAEGLDDSQITMDRNGFWGDNESTMIDWNGQTYRRSQFSAFASAERGLIGSICANPLFVASSGSNLRLQSGSPMIGKGRALGLTRDIAGNPVPATNPDLGAYQFVRPAKQVDMKSAVKTWLAFQ